MPRATKPPRLYLRERKGREPQWVILDAGGYEQSTSCGPGEERGAEEAFKRYLASKHESAVGTHEPAALPIADLLNFYGDLKEPKPDAPKAEKSAYSITTIRIGHLLAFWGHRPTSDIRGATCRDYVRWRSNEGPMAPGWPPRRPTVAGEQTARRELVILSSAVGAYHKEYTLDMVPSVTLPDLAESTRHALSHSEAAALLAGALGWYREGEGRLSGGREAGPLKRHPKATRTKRKRTARFIIIGLYSGSRHTSITAAKWIPSVDGPWIDVDRGVLHRRGDGEAENNKRRPPAKIPPRLLAHLRRWRELDLAQGIVHVMSRNGKPLAGQLRKGWAGARHDAGLPDTITPHVMRHTAATWLSQGGVETRKAADYLGMSERTFEKVYYSASPDYQADIGPGFASSKVRASAIKNGQGSRPNLPKHR